MAAGSHSVRIDGLAEFNRALRKIDRDAPKGLRIAMNDSAKIIVDWARPRIPRRSGRAMRSVKASSTRTRARVVGGGPRVPYYPWLDFGGITGASGVSRPFQTRGRYIYEGFFQNRAKFTDKLEQSLRKIVTEAGLDVTRGG